MVISFGHQPPAVLCSPCVRTGESSRDHDLFGARGHLTHSTGGVVVVYITQCSPKCCIHCAVQYRVITVGRGGLRVVVDVSSCCCTDVVGSSSSLCEVSARSKAMIDQPCSSNTWAHCPPPPDVGRSSGGASGTW